MRLMNISTSEDKQWKRKINRWKDGESLLLCWYCVKLLPTNHDLYYQSKICEHEFLFQAFDFLKLHGNDELMMQTINSDCIVYEEIRHMMKIPPFTSLQLTILTLDHCKTAH